MRPSKRVRFDQADYQDDDGNQGDTGSEDNDGKLLAKDVVELCLVTESGQFPVDSDTEARVAGESFVPKYLHQVFAKESIYGYTSAKLRVYYDPLTLRTFVSEQSQLLPRVHVAQKGKDEAPVARKRTELIPSIAKLIRGGICETRGSFVENFSKRDEYVAPVSNLIRRYRIGDVGYGVFKESFADNNADLVDFHSRIEFFMFVHIEGASFIDHSDPRWEIYFIHRLDSEDRPREFIGYATTYPFSAMRTGAGISIDDAFEVRLRISQVLIMPHAQGKGHGSRLLHSIYEEAAIQDVLEVTVEDPSEGFRALRDLTDLRRAYTLGILTYGKSFLETGSDDECISMLRKQFNMTKSQARRCLEVHALGCVSESDEIPFKKFRLWVKRRLHTDFLEILDHLGKEEMKAKLAELFDDIMNEYRVVIERLEKRGVQLPTSFSQRKASLEPKYK